MSWCAKKQSTVSRSSIEAEYRSIASTTSEIMCIQSLLSELQVHTNSKATIWCDKISAISLTANPILHSRTKHMELDLYFIREQVMKDKIRASYIPSTYQKADVLTKPLSQQSFANFIRELNVDIADINQRSQVPVYIPEAVQELDEDKRLRKKST